MRAGEIPKIGPVINTNTHTDNGSTTSTETSPNTLAKATLHRGTKHYLHDGPPPDGFLTAAELRNRWRCSGMFLWRMRKKGALTAYKIGERGVRFLLAEIERIEREAMTVKGGV